MKSRTICWRCVSPCIVWARLLNVRSIVNKQGTTCPVHVHRLHKRRVLAGVSGMPSLPPTGQEMHVHVHVAGLALLGLAVLALEAADEARVHPLTERLLVGAIELDDASLMARA